MKEITYEKPSKQELCYCFEGFSISISWRAIIVAFFIEFPDLRKIVQKIGIHFIEFPDLRKETKK